VQTVASQKDIIIIYKKNNCSFLLPNLT